MIIGRSVAVLGLAVLWISFTLGMGLSSAPAQEEAAGPTEQGGPARDPGVDAEKNSRPLRFRPMDIGSIVQDSPLVFLGALLESSAEKDERQLIVSRNLFAIDTVLVGSYEDRNITLTTLGGTIGKESLRVSHMPVFRKSQRYIIFTDPGRKTYDPVTRNRDGVLLVGPDEGVYSYSGFSITGVEKGIMQTGEYRLKGLFADAPRGPTRLKRESKSHGGQDYATAGQGWR